MANTAAYYALRVARANLGGFRGLSSSTRTLSAADASEPATAHDGKLEDCSRLKIVVLGGRGFVGSNVCQEALTTGLHVVGLSRSGTPPLVKEPWVGQVEWSRANALEPLTYAHHLKDAAAVISCVGAFGSQQEMLKINGTANVAAIQAAKEAGVPRFVFISANIPNMPGIELLLGGYVNGKRMVEEELRKLYPDAGVYLRPGVIYGSRVVSSNLTLPLQYAFQPLEMLLERLPATKQLTGLPLVGAAFVPPISVQAVARAAVRAATDPSMPAGAMEVWDIQQYR